LFDYLLTQAYLSGQGFAALIEAKYCKLFPLEKLQPGIGLHPERSHLGERKFLRFFYLYGAVI
jgi:hypothetical protein